MIRKNINDSYIGEYVLKTYIITGRPGIGKSTLFNNIVNELTKYNIVVGGIRSPEVRDNRGYRIGFKIIDLLSGEEGWLAKKNYYSPIRVGKYGVVIDDAKRVIEKALTKAIEEADVIAIDEVGPMELKIDLFRKLLYKVLETNKPKILVFHIRLNDPTIWRKVKEYELFTVTLENREHLNKTLPKKILKEIQEFLAKR